MNSLNDLIQSHDMYDPAHIQRSLGTEPQEYPPVEAYEEATYVTSPPLSSRPSSYIPQYQAIQPYRDQSAYTAQDSKTLQSMMREISLMQRRLDIMMSSCEAMIERTQIMHEYHHIARYRSDHHIGMGSSIRPRYAHQAPHPVHTPVYQVSPYQDHSHGEERTIPERHAATPAATSHGATTKDEQLTIKEGVFDGTNMISADGDMYAIPTEFVCAERIIEGDIMQAMVFASGRIQYKVSEPTAREHIMGILSTHAANSPHYIVQTANKAYKVLKEAVEHAGGTPGNQILLTVPAGGESEWAAIHQVFNR